MALEDVQKLASTENLPFHAVAAEIIQIAFLDALYGQKESTEIAFHGGTSIRLLHGGYRYSEDLDFAVTAVSHATLQTLLEKAVRKTEHLLTTVFGNSTLDLAARPVKKESLAAWWLKLSPAGYRGKIHVKLEFGRYPVYQRQTFPVTLRNPLIPVQPLVVSPSIDELFLDKINALAGRPYMKERDLFDMWYMTTVLKPKIDYELLARKFRDYRTAKPVETLKKRLAEINPSSLASTMEKFLPERYRRPLSLNRYQKIVDANKALIGELLQNLA